MANYDYLENHPFFSEPIEAPKINEDELAARIERSQADLPPPPTGSEVAKDIGRSVVSGGAKGLVGSLIGGPGSIETFFAKDIPSAIKSGGAYLAERADLISPQQRKEISESPLYLNETPEQARGEKSPIFGLPTYKAVTESFPGMAKKAGAEALAYEPQTTQGKVAYSGAEMGAQGVPGAIRTMPGRVMTGVGAGVGSEIAGLSSTDPDREGYNKLLGALGGAGAGALGASAAGRLFNGIKALAFSSKTAQNELVDMISDDIRRGLSPMTIEQFEEAQRRGAPVTVLDLAGPSTLKKLGVAAERTPENEAIAAAYNDFLQARAQESGSRITGTLESVMGSRVDAPAYQEAIEWAGKNVRNDIYDAMHKDPAAGAVPLRAIGVDVLKRPVIQQAMRDAAISAENNPGWGIIVPTAQNEGNLAYWDQVKKELDSRLKSAKSPTNPNPSDVATLTANKNDLVKRLDAAVPSYAQVRDIASDTFSAASAPEAGYNYFKNMDAFKRAEARNAMAKYSPEQREMFAMGYAANIDEVASKPGGISMLAKKFSSDRNFRERTMDVLGPERYAQIQGAVLSENVMSKAKELRFIEQASGLKQASMTGAVAGAGLEAMVAGSVLSPNVLAKAALGAAVAAGGKFALNATERRIAEKIIPMAVDPDRAAELGRLASQSSAVGGLLDKIVGAMNNRITVAGSGTQTTQNRPQRASGGRAGGMTADMLIAAAERAKKSIGKDTEALLATPDASVAKALAVANQKLEG